MDESRVTLEDLTPVRKRLRIEIPAHAVSVEIERAFQRVGQRARLPGFRPGKAPRTVLERVFGDDVRREVLGQLVEASFSHAVGEHALAIVGTPEIDVDGITAGEPLRYSATVDVQPTIVLGDLGGLEAQRPSAEVQEDEVERVLGAMRESVAQLRPVEDRSTVEAGDVVRVDLTSRLEGGEPTRREGVLLEAGGGSFPLALERQLVGQHRGARLSLRVTYPREYPNGGLAGKTVDFEVDVGDIRTKDLPPLDDEFARDHGRCESLVDLRVRIREDLERQAAVRAEEMVREAIIEQLLARHPFDVPGSLVERRTEALIASLGVRLPDGAERERVLEQLRGQVAPRAERQLRAELLLDAVARRDGVTVSEDDVATEIAAMATRERRVPEQVRAIYERPEARAALCAKLVRDRVLSGLVACARVVPSARSVGVADEK